MYLDMVNERSVELKGIAQFVDAQAKAKAEKKDLVHVPAGLGGLIGDKKKQARLLFYSRLIFFVIRISTFVSHNEPTQLLNNVRGNDDHQVFKYQSSE